MFIGKNTFSNAFVASVMNPEVSIDTKFNNVVSVRSLSKRSACTQVNYSDCGVKLDTDFLDTRTDSSAKLVFLVMIPGFM